MATAVDNPTSRALHGSTYRPDIDGLRALAIIPVVLFHAFPTITPGGFVGVDIFFVISGFLISGIILQGMQRGRFSFAAFYRNRVKRLFPALLVVLAACFIFGWFFLLPDEYTQLGKHIVGAAAYIENFVVRREAGYFDTASYMKPLMHLWSLGVEEQFYLTYPLFLWLVWRFRSRLLTILLLIGAASFCLNIWQVHHDPVAAFFLPQTRCWEFMMGGALAWWQMSKGDYVRPALGSAFSIVGILLIAIAVFGIHEHDPFPGWRALLPASGAALLILGGPNAQINRRLLTAGPCVLIGLISYPLYLWHWPILTLPRVIHGSELSPGARFLAVLLSFALAWATWRYIENPIRFGSRPWIASAALAALSVVIGFVGYTAYHQDGFISRFPYLPADLGRLPGYLSSTPECRGMVGLAKIDYCRSSANHDPDVLLLGDSHAGVLYRGLAPAYTRRAQTLVVLGEAGCVPFYDTDAYSPDVPEPQGCKTVVNRILDFAISSRTAHTIILSFRGPLNMSGQDFTADKSERVTQKIVWAGAPATVDQSETFAGALTNTLSRLYSTGKTLILVADWPELDFDPRSCLPRPVALFSNPRALCGVPRDEVERRNRDYRRLISELQKTFPRLKVFDPFPYLCDSTACYAMNDGHLFYRDHDHLSAAGAEYLSAKFLAEQDSQQQSLVLRSSTQP